MYNNIRKKKNAAAPHQIIVNEVVKKRTAGRPRRDNMRKITIKMDKVLYEKVVAKAQEIGTSASFVIGEGARCYLGKEKN